MVTDRSRPKRLVVWNPGDDEATGVLPPATPVARIFGGERTMHEIAAATATLGHAVEMRGRVSASDVAELSAAAGVRLELPDGSRPIEADDVVLMPEGVRDPLVWADLVLSPARAIAVLLAPPGLFGWPFVAGWESAGADVVALDAVGTPEQLRAMASIGCELWTHMPLLAEQAHAAGVQCAFIGNGRPMPYPPAGERRYDVATITENRWAPQAQAVLARLNGVRHVAIEGTNAEVLEQLGQSRILIHPLRIEGHSRLGCEARAMGAVPVVLESNRYAVGLDSDGGAIRVPSLDEMPAAIEALLADPGRWAALSERGMRSAREQVDWDTFVGRVARALDSGGEDPARGARATFGSLLRGRERARVGDLEAQLAGERETAEARATHLTAMLEHEQRVLAHEQQVHAHVVAQRDGLRAERDRLGDDLRAASASLEQMRATRVWRAGQSWYRFKARLRRGVSRTR